MQMFQLLTCFSNPSNHDMLFNYMQKNDKKGQKTAKELFLKVRDWKKYFPTL